MALPFIQNLNRSTSAVAERKHAARIGIKFEFQLAHPVIHCRDWNAMFLTPCFASLLTGLKFMDSFRPQCDFFIMIQFPSFVMKKVYQKNMGANRYG
jgi:hypothetical protein